MKKYTVKINADLFIKNLEAKDEQEARNKIMKILETLEIDKDVNSINIIEK